MSDTQNNIIRFNYLVDPTTLMSNSWITTNTDTTQNTVTGIDPTTVTTTYRDVTYSISAKGSVSESGVLRVVYIERFGEFVVESVTALSGNHIENFDYDATSDILTIYIGKGGYAFNNFALATENTTYTDDLGDMVENTWSYVNGTSTVTTYDHYEVELYVNSDVTTFPNNLFYADNNITSVEFDTYSITSIEDGFANSGAFLYCYNLSSIILPNNLEYIGDYAIFSNITSITLPSTLNEIGEQGLNIQHLSITSLAAVPPILHSMSITVTSTLIIHETALQSYINSDWVNYVTSISTIETPTYNNVLKFNYSTDPTEKLNNLWVNYCTDTSANTIEGVGEKEVEVTKHWRDVTYSNSRGDSGTVRVGWENNTYTDEFDVISYEGLEPNDVTLSRNGVLQITNIDGNSGIAQFGSFSTAVENQEYSFSFKSGGPTGTISYTNATTTETITVYDHYEVTLYINSALNTFETTMFADDDNITSIEFDYDVTSIIDDAFNGCENLSSVTFTSTVPPTICEDTFSLISPDAVLYVPNTSIPAYQNAGYGDYFAEIRGMTPVPPKRSGFNVSGMIDTDFIIEVYKRR